MGCTAVDEVEPVTRDEVAGVIVARVLHREGGIAQLEGESWVTRFGQTPAWLQQFGLPAPRTVGEAIANYRTWLVRTRLIGLCDQPDSLADGTIDFAVHSGHQIAIRGLQRALGIAVDGILGPETQAAIDRCDRALMGRRIVADRLRFLGRLITQAPQQNAKWAAGWCARVADQIEALA